MRKALLAAMTLVGACCLPLALRAAQAPVQQPHGDLKTDCGECHSAERWSPVARPSRFDHASTGFKLEGAHRQARCTGCHQSLVFNRVGTACADCHKDVHRGELGTNCETCHSPRSWSNQREMFQVHNRTRFPLLAAHASLDCQACHKGQRQGEFANTPSQCYACHAETYARTTAPNHAQAHFSTRCEQCHGVAPRGWQSVVGFAHPATFPLAGPHGGLACAACHTGGFANLSRECFTCHQQDYQQAANPNHVARNFPHQCDQCHNGTSWHPAKFDHTLTRFTLSGGHAGVACERCHPGQRYAGTSMDCVACHQANYNQAANPNHVASHFATTCQNCHSVQAWRPANFDHNNTRFRLTGAHGNVACERCHPGQRYTGTPMQCYSCHQTNFQQASNPSHSGFPTTCEACHTTQAWRPANFDHNNTRFRLTGAHGSVACERCHRNGQYSGTPTQCYACHQSNYQQAQNPSHASFPTTCESCHTTQAWRPANFDHNNTRFRLTGAHSRTPCASCHRNGQYSGTPTQCYACHQSNYQQAQNPSHASFPTTCESCHTTQAWRPANFDHNNTRFRLTGAHTRTPCTSCHRNGQYSGTPTQCHACHQSDYQQASNPSHSGFPTSCESCHNTNGWRPASFDHSRTRFPLTGAHTRTPCASCHRNGQYSGTPRDCYTCHTSDYNGTTNPNHRAAGFPTACNNCHTTNAWRPASFDHDGRYFPIYSGKHRGEWSECSDCHVNPGNYRVFECINCHEHNRADMDREHRGVGGYQYNSAACLRCHPRGVAD